MSVRTPPNRYLLRTAFVAERLEAGHMRYNEFADDLGLSRSHFSLLMNRHRHLTPRVRRALLDHPLFADVSERDLWDVLPPRFEQLTLPCAIDAGDDQRGAA